MKLFDMLRGVTRETRAVDQSWNALAGGGNVSASGAYVDAKSAESISTVFACVQALSESTSTLPLHVYRRTDDGSRERADGHWLSRLLDHPNEWQTGFDFRESMTAAVLLHGNAYARKELNGAGEVVQLHPMASGRTSIVQLDSGRYRYDYTDERGRVVRLLADEVFHLRDRTDPGSIVGKSRIATARDTLGLAVTLRQHASGFFGRGARPASVVNNETARDLTTEQINAIRDSLNNFASPANAGKTLIMGVKGLKYESIGMSMEDAQWIAAQQFGVTEICRIFRVPPLFVQTLEQASYNNVTSLSDTFVKFSLARWLTMWEEGVSRSLLGPIARQRYYCEHAVDALLRAQAGERAEFYSKALNSEPWMTVDEVRRLENLPKRDVDAS